MNTRPESGPLSTRRHFLQNATAAAIALLLTSGIGEKVKKRPTETATAQGAQPNEEEQKFWRLELDAAIDDCLEACDSSDVISLIAACVCLKEGGEADLHSMAKKTSPRMRAALQKLAGVLLMRPHLARQGCRALRGKLNEKPSTDYRRLLTGLLPPDDDPIFSKPFVVIAIAKVFLDDEERSKILSAKVKELIMERGN